MLSGWICCDQTGAQSPVCKGWIERPRLHPKVKSVRPSTNTISRNIRERLYPGEQELSVLLRHCSDARYVWNLALEQHNLRRRERSQKITYNTQAHELSEARKESWLKEGSAAVQQQALRDLNQAFQNWWKRPDHFGRPTWRKAGINEGFAVRDLSVRRINRKWGQVFVPKCGWVKFRVTREWSDIETASSARVTLDRSGRWFVSFTRLAPQMERKSTGAIVGIDMGVTHTVATSNGEFLDMPELLTKGEHQRKRRLQRRLARQVKGSNRYKATKLAIAKLAAKEVDRRKDWIEWTTTDLVRDYDLISLETLKIKNMTIQPKEPRTSLARTLRQSLDLTGQFSNRAGACSANGLLTRLPML